MFCFLGGFFLLFCRRVISLGGCSNILKKYVGTVCLASIAIDSYQKGNDWNCYVPLKNTEKKTGFPLTWEFVDYYHDFFFGLTLMSSFFFNKTFSP